MNYLENIRRYRAFSNLIGLEFVFAAFVIYYFIEEFLEIQSMGIDYFGCFHNCLDICVILVSKNIKGGMKNMLVN